MKRVRSLEEAGDEDKLANNDEQKQSEISASGKVPVPSTTAVLPVLQPLGLRVNDILARRTRVERNIADSISCLVLVWRNDRCALRSTLKDW